MLKKIVVSFLVALFCAGGLSADEGTSENQAASMLKKASALRRTSFKKPKEEKERIQLEAAACYEEIIVGCPGCASECAEASFRAGEIYRTLRLTEQAEKSFLRTLKFSRKGEFAARSINEVGHICRRKKDYVAAIACYRRTLAECAGVRDECGEAETWIGKVYLKMGDVDKGRQTLLAFAERFPEFPLAAIRNMDLAAQSFIREGRFVEAAGVVDRCRSLFEGAPGRSVSLEKKIEKALRSMKSAEASDQGREMEKKEKQEPKTKAA
jgi:tetratricopeptide (TPR) repeat protein